MCVAIPGRIIRTGEVTGASIPATIQVGDHTHDVDLMLVPEADVGDYVIAHSGFAIRRLSSEEAAEVRTILASARPDRG